MFLVTFFFPEKYTAKKSEKQTWKTAGVIAVLNEQLNKICISIIKAGYQRAEVKCSMAKHQGQL